MLNLDQQNEWREAYRRSHPGWQPATELYFDVVCRFARSGARILDLGCGRGGLVEQLPEPRPWVAGVDPDWQSLAEHRLAHMPRAAGLSDTLPFARESFDLVVASWLLEHLDQPHATFAEIARVLEHGGRFAFITPNAGHPLSAANRVFGRAGYWQKQLVRRAYGRDEGDTFPTRYLANSPAKLQALATSAGLRLVQLLTVADPSYLAFSPVLFRLMAYVEDRLPQQRRIHLVGVMEK